MENAARERHVRFGPFEVDLRNRELRRRGVRLRVQRQPFAVLETLLESPGDLVTREALRQRLWPEGTFVEFDKGLNTAVMKLREALGEDPHTPHFIETVAGEGYRFVAPVEVSTPIPDLPGADAETSAAVLLADVDAGADEAARPRVEPPSSGRRWTAAVWLAAAGVLGAAAVAALLLRPSPTPATGELLRFALREPAGVTFNASGSFMALSPDGRAIAFVASPQDGVQRLWLQPLDSLTAHELEGTEYALQPFWSPDGRSLAFFAEGRLKRLDLAGGSARTLDTVLPGGIAGDWSDDGRLLYSSSRSGSSTADRGLLLGSAEGGPAALVPPPSGLDPDTYLWWPRLLPDGRSYLFLALGGAPERNGIHVAPLDGGPAQRIVPAISSVEYADGRLFYVDGGVLVAQRFDADRRRTTGRAVPIADGVLVNPRTGRAPFSVSAANRGIVAYRQPSRSRLEWFDRSGVSLGPTGAPAVYHEFAIAPDGERVAASIVDLATGVHAIWILDAEGAKRRFTDEPGLSPLWSADGNRIAYVTGETGRWRLLVKPVAEGASELVAESTGPIAPTDWTGDVLVIGRSHPKVEVKLHDISGVRVLAEPSMGLRDTASPDLRWIAWTRDDNRASETAIYVDAMAPKSGRWHVAERASEARWRKDGRELYYLEDDRTLMAVSVSGETSLDPSAPVRLFATAGVGPSGIEGRTYDVSPDGRRFLVKVATEPAAIVVLANWHALLEDEDGTAPKRPD